MGKPIQRGIRFQANGGLSPGGGEFYVYGAGGHGKVAASLLQDSGGKVVGFLDDDSEKVGSQVLGAPILGGWAYLEKVLLKKKYHKLKFVVGIGDNHNRKRVFEKLKGMGIKLVSAIHPSCVIHSSVVISEGTVVMPGVIINAESSIGKNVILNTGVSVDHDCVVEDHVHLAPGAVLAGGVHVEKESFVGAGAVLIPGVKIGANSVIGAGAVVLKDIPSGEKAVGVPAKIV